MFINNSYVYVFSFVFTNDDLRLSGEGREEWRLCSTLRTGSYY